ncbi:MAG: beta-propeller domain-containing protein [Eubacterium sp.]|nr:beta-propeller domain-containing protein [Eubacterium sp.]
MKDRDFITSKFESENITAPESLSEENIKARLEQGTSVNNIVKLKKSRRRPLRRLAAIAACIALIIGTGISANAIHDASIDRMIKKNTESGIVHFTSYNEIEEYSGRLVSDSGGYKGLFLPKTGVLYSKNADVLEESAADGTATTGAVSEAYSDTYKQVDGVDEADIVKTDGKYIYMLNTTDCSLSIYSVSNGTTELCTKEFYEDDVATYEEMFLDGDRLYLLSTEHTDDETKSVVRAYDITDRKKIRELDTYKQSGVYSTSRMVGGYIYVISNTYTYDKKFVPCCTGEDGTYKKIPAEDICAFEHCQQPNYAVISAINTKNGLSKERKVKAVMGGANNVYCTTETLYVSCADYNGVGEGSTIVKYSIDGISIKEKAVARVNGYINNQWSLDEKDGYLRVASTATRDNGEQINMLYVLDGELKKVGSVGGYARDEHIEAVKYIGDMAYVITYETTDPLFCIDLSNPKDPKITGEVKIDGFSTNLVPVGENKLMGIGYSTKPNPDWGGVQRDGVKLALFDVSNKNEPKVLDEKVYQSADSPAQLTHKAILKSGDTLAIPVNDYEGGKGTALVFGEKDGKINVISEHKTNGSVDRVIYAGGYYYAINVTGNSIDAFELK